MTAVKTAINLWYRHTVSFKLNIYIYTLLKFDTVTTALFKFSRPFGYVTENSFLLKNSSWCIDWTTRFNERVFGHCCKLINNGPIGIKQVNPTASGES